MNPGCALFPYIPAIFLSLHLLYEDMKLDSTLYSDLHQLANLLSRLAGIFPLVCPERGGGALSFYFRSGSDKLIRSPKESRSLVTPPL